MALSPADFYAYSQATGAPVPEDPSQRAAMAPEVLAFRRNQLKTPQQGQEQGFDPLSVGVGVGLALAGGIGAGLGVRKLLRGPKQSANAGVRQANLEKFAAETSPVRRAVQETQVEPSKVTGIQAPGAPETDVEYVSPYRKGPTYQDVYPSRFEFPRISEETIAARREASQQQAALTKALTPGTYQMELGGPVSPTLMQLRSSEFGPNLTETRRQALGLAEQYVPSVPFSEAPGQLDIFKYSATPQRDVAQELVDEYVRNTGLETKRQQKIQRDIATQKEGMAMRVIDELRQEAKQEAAQPKGFNPRKYIEQTGAVAPVEDLTSLQQVNEAQVIDQKINAVESGEDQMTGRVRQQLQRNEDLDMGQVDLLEEIAEYNYIQGMEQDEPINRVASQLADGLPVDQAEGLKVLDLRNKQSFQIPPRALGQQQNESQLLNQARQYLLSKEIDTDFDYSTENRIQAAQVQDRIQKAQYLREQADQILADIKAEGQPQAQQVSPQEFAAQFNKKYKEELNDQLRDIDNARQRAELKAAQSATIGEDIESLLLGDPSLVDTTMRGKALRGGKPNITGDIVYQDAAGEFVSADTGLKTRLKQGPEYKIKSLLLNELNTASDENLTELISKGQQAPMNQYLKSLVTSKYGLTQQLDLPSQIIDSEQIFGTQFDESLARMASNVLRARASRNLEPTDLQLSALDRAKASVAASQEVLKQMRNPRPTVSPGPAQDVARTMETLRRGMVVEPSEPLPVLPSINQLRTGYATDEELGPILGAADVYTGAAAEAAGPVIFTGKSKANSVIRGPRITGSVNTPTGRYLTQDNPDVLGTVYEVAGTRANREISAQVEANAQAFLADALAGGLTAKAAVSPERFVTPGRTQLKQLELSLDPGASAENAAQVSRMSPLSLQSTLGLPGQQPSQRTLYARYQPGRSGTTPLSPFIGDMPGGTVVIQPTPSDIPNTRRDIGTPPGSRIDLTRRGAKARFFPDFLLGDVPQETSVTGMEPAPIGPLTQSPGSPRIGGYQQQAVLGAGRVPTTQLTSIGQRVAYPRMSPLVKAPDYSGNIATNIPLYGIDPGAEDWRNDLMRSAFRRGGPIRTYQA